MHLYPFTDAYAMFFIYAFIGWIVEVVYYGFEEGKFINRGFLNGPLCPVYGIGFYGVILLLERLSYNFFLLFFGSMVICTFVEFWAGFILLKIFDLRWWDYRNEKYNFMGLICPKFSMYWGIACSLGMFVLHPTVLWILGKTPDVLQIVLLCVFTAILISDLITTVLAIIGFKKRLGFITGISGEMKALSDRIGGSIYGRVDTVRTKSQPALENYGVWRTVYNEHRKEERELARKHRAEEKALFGELFPKMDPSSIHPREAIAARVSSAVKSLKAPERRILRTVYTNVGEHGKTAFDNLTKLFPFSKRPEGDGPSDEESLTEE
ncbi:MAG: putative ABC transporter permease [Clostridiales bacterium]|nr:putative ABC transporter permease [Clostridiales bacterium]